MTAIEAPRKIAAAPLARLKRLLSSQQKLHAVVKSAVQVFAIRLLGVRYNLNAPAMRSPADTGADSTDTTAR